MYTPQENMYTPQENMYTPQDNYIHHKQICAQVYTSELAKNSFTQLLYKLFLEFLHHSMLS